MKNTYTALFVGVIFLDQITKLSALSYLKHTIQLTRFFSFELVLNRGISWGLFQAAPTNSVLFIVVTSLIVVLTIGLAVYAYRRTLQGHTIYSELLVIAGSTSNIIDRFVHGGVIDFLTFHWNDLYWPAFNIADIGIVLGILGMAFNFIFSEPRPSGGR